MLCIIKFLIFNSIILLFINHPLTMGMCLLIQTITMTLIMGYMYLNFWYSYMLLIIMIGGMLILFMYMTSVASNEIFSNFNNFFKFFFIYMISFSIINQFIDTFIMNNNYFFNFINSFNNYYNINKFLNFPSNLTLLLIMTFLLLTMIIIVNIINKNKGPLRQMY
uniref:NADH-ubiquinone oxidoreductase chain 6 n=1 Tax=Discolomatidae sp. 4 ACP-2013 TaxID=1434487 RepID=A0A3G3FWV7_9CUCU|nr:NADH dehydrogenase subunit 6 [Discolomatidae sp. 4 ACP-2013]